MIFLFLLVIVFLIVLTLCCCLILKSFSNMERRICAICNEREFKQKQDVHSPNGSSQMPLNLTNEIIQEWFYGEAAGKEDKN